MKKTAFTLAEVLIVLGIIGIIVTFGLKAALQNDKGIRHIYSNTYHVLDTSLYNAMNFSNSPNPFDLGITSGNASGADAGTKRLCQKLTEYINTVEPNPCNASAATSARPARPDSSLRLISDVGSDAEFTESNVQFTATNGVRYFLSRRMPLKGIGGARQYQNGDPMFFIIYADINGWKRPNSMEYRAVSDVNHRKYSKDPDIFAFAVIENGRVLPLGPPEFDGRFMLSRVSYYNIENSHNDDHTDVLFSRPSQPYYLMKAQAWGYYNADGIVPDTFFIEDNPYTYNGYVKSKISPNSQIYAFVQGFYTGNNVTKVPAAANLKSAPVNQGGYNCVRQSDEECDVIIDKYVY